MNKLSSGLPRLALIAGPTASGKSALALTMAEKTGGVIVNADASQVYRDLRILSARPSAADEARAEHRLFGHVDAAQACTAADWAADARETIAAVQATGRFPILVGGTGLYIRTLLDGIADVPPIEPAVRAEVRSLATDDAYAALQVEDSGMAARLRPSDSLRIARALEVRRSTGRSLADWQKETRGGIAGRVDLRPIVLMPDREALFQACAARFAAMLAWGAADEVAQLRARGLDPALPAMRAIGVREIGAWLDGAASREDAEREAVLATRRYAKRQITWLRTQTPAAWPRLTDLASAKADLVATMLLE
jgi:tRNA dimethylallyltransferase